MRVMMFVLLLITLFMGAAGKKCSCKFEGTRLEESTYQASAYANLSHISIYGTSCAAWDAVPGTPIFESRCKESHASDWCDPKVNFCQAPWCYVDDADCDGATPTDIFDATHPNLHYSYSPCGAKNCYTDKDTGAWAAEDCTGKPWDPFGDGTCRNEKPNCACIFRGSELESRVYSNTSYATLPTIEAYGTTCAAWDGMPDTPLFDSDCKSRGDCEKSWCGAPWCYVDVSCPGSQRTHVFSPRNFFYSYAACGAPDCFNYTGVEMDERCPWNPDGKCTTAPTSELSFEDVVKAEVLPDDDTSQCYGAGGFTKDAYPLCLNIRPGLFMYYGKSGDFMRLGLHAVRHSGWSALSLSGNGGMKGASMIVVRMEGNQWIAEDRHSEDYVEPKLDVQQDVELVFAHEVNGDTSWGVLLPLSSCDAEDEEIIEDYPRQMLWALGTGHKFSYHMHNRGTFMANLISGPKVDPEIPADAIETSLKMNQVPVVLSKGGSSPTNPYKCVVSDLNQVLPTSLQGQKVSAVAIGPDLDPVSEKYNHHIVVSSCSPFQMVANAAAVQHEWQVPAQHGYVIENCEDMPCGDIIYAWAVGGKKLVFPTDTGMPMGEPVDRRWIVTQIHYYNPTLDQGIKDSSGVKFTFSPQARPVDVGMLTLNAGIDESTRPAGLAPGIENLKIKPLILPKECTQNWPHNITILSTSHHAHLLGKNVEIHQLRDGEYQGTIRRERLYDFNHQSFLEGPAKTIKKGDEIWMTCTYNTKFQKEVTPFSDFTDTEMCMAFVMYYPKLPHEMATYVDLAAWGLPNSVGVHNGACPEQNGSPVAVIQNSDVTPTCTKQGVLSSTEAAAVKAAMKIDPPSTTTEPAPTTTKADENSSNEEPASTTTSADDDAPSSTRDATTNGAGHCVAPMLSLAAAALLML